MPAISARTRPGRRRRRIMIMSVVPLLLSLATVLATVTPASAEVIPPGSMYWGKIYGLASNPANCVDNSGLEVNGQAGYFIINSCENTDYQQFSYDITDNQIYDGSDGGSTCMGVAPNYGNGPGTPINSVPCNSGYWHTWHIVKQTLVNAQTGLCLDDTNWGGPGTFLQLWTCNGASAQNWDIVGYHK
jgi:hypothetical protein